VLVWRLLEEFGGLRAKVLRSSKTAGAAERLLKFSAGCKPPLEPAQMAIPLIKEFKFLKAEVADS